MGLLLQEYKLWGTFNWIFSCTRFYGSSYLTKCLTPKLFFQTCPEKLDWKATVRFYTNNSSFFPNLLAMKI